jgi:putative drug exporter of the RND superfamily
LALVYGLTFLPALLGVLGPRIDSVRIGIPGRSSRAHAAVTRQTSGESRFWHEIAQRVMRYPVRVLVPVLAVLLVAGIPFLHLELRAGGIEILPADSPPRVVSDRLRTEFPSDESDPIPVIVTAEDGNPLSTGSLDALRSLVRQAEGIPGVIRVDSIVSDQSNSFDWSTYSGDPAMLPKDLRALAMETVRPDAVLVQVVTDTEGSGTERVTRELRGLTVDGLEFAVGGFAASSIDTVDGIESGIVPAVIFVIVGAYLILLLTFGSVFLPLKAIIMTLLSISASLGAVVLVFQDGYLSSLLGFTATGRIDAIQPILTFCILFGLSMDYEVLMLARMQEEYRRTGDNTAAVAAGLERTATMVTGAAAIMVVVFGGFLLAEIVIIKSLGFGLALAVLIDATIVRGLLVPATMRLMGNWNWWAPRPIQIVVARLGLAHA